MQAEIPADGSAYLDFRTDIFLFSYLSAGINFEDIATLRYCDMDEERIYHARHKTSKEMTCHLSNKSKAIIGKYAKSDHADEDYIFPDTRPPHTQDRATDLRPSTQGADTCEQGPARVEPIIGAENRTDYLCRSAHVRNGLEAFGE